MGDTKAAVTPRQARFVVQRALEDHKLSAEDVQRYLESMHEEISAIEKKLARLRAAVIAPFRRILRRRAGTTQKSVVKKATVKATAKRSKKAPAHVTAKRAKPRRAAKRALPTALEPATAK